MSRIALAVESGASAFPRLDEVAAWLQALRLRDWNPGRTFSAPIADEIAATLTGVAAIAVRHVCACRAPAESDLVGLDLAAASVEARRRAVEQLATTAAYARAIRCAWIIVELGSHAIAPIEGAAAAARRSDELLDRVCRSLHEVLQREPQVGIALAPPRDETEWLRPIRLVQIVEDLGVRRRVGYWHDAGRAHALATKEFTPEASWLDLLAPHCVGVDATDALGEQSGLPAGAGEVDFGALAQAVSSATPWIVRCDPFIGAAPLAPAVAHLRKVLR